MIEIGITYNYTEPHGPIMPKLSSREAGIQFLDYPFVCLSKAGGNCTPWVSKIFLFCGVTHKHKQKKKEKISKKNKSEQAKW